VFFVSAIWATPIRTLAAALWAITETTSHTLIDTFEIACTQKAALDGFKTLWIWALIEFCHG
jgi:hypothetical protein